MFRFSLIAKSSEPTLLLPYRIAQGKLHPPTRGSVILTFLKFPNIVLYKTFIFLTFYLQYLYLLYVSIKCAALVERSEAAYRGPPRLHCISLKSGGKVHLWGWYPFLKFLKWVSFSYRSTMAALTKVGIVVNSISRAIL